MATVVVTGGAGFIGANFVRYLLTHSDSRVAIIDKLTYAGNLASLRDVLDNPRVSFIEGDISDRPLVEHLYSSTRPAAIVNFAAESHVDRSIDNPQPFVETNIIGTFVLLEVTRKYLRTLPEARQASFRFLHVSTDEVYGSLGSTGLFTEMTPYAPNSPYAASKAGADHLVRAYHETYQVPALVTNCSNNYGPYQFPEKLIPLMILNAIEGRQLPIYGDGGNVRDWLFVEDHCAGIELVLRQGVPGEKYNIGGGNERTNLEIVDTLCNALEERLPAERNDALGAMGLGAYQELMTFVADRPGHDRRYAIDAAKIRRELGWQPTHDFKSGLERTVEWYLANREWCSTVVADKYSRERLGLAVNQD